MSAKVVIGKKGRKLTAAQQKAEDEATSRSHAAVIAEANSQPPVHLEAAAKERRQVERAETKYKRMKVASTTADFFMGFVFKGGTARAVHPVHVRLLEDDGRITEALRPSIKACPSSPRDMLVPFSLPFILEHILVPSMMLGGGGGTITMEKLSAPGGVHPDQVNKNALTVSGQPKWSTSMSMMEWFSNHQKGKLEGVDGDDRYEKPSVYAESINSVLGRSYLFKGTRWWEFLDEIEFEVLQRIANEGFYNKESFDSIMSQIGASEKKLRELEEERASAANTMAEVVSLGTEAEPQIKKWKLQSSSEGRFRHLLTGVEEGSRKHAVETARRAARSERKKSKHCDCGDPSCKNGRGSDANENEVPVFSLAMSPKVINPDEPLEEQVLDCPKMDIQRKKNRRCFQDHHARLWRHNKKEVRKMYDAFEDLDDHWTRLVKTPVKDLRDNIARKAARGSAAAESSHAGPPKPKDVPTFGMMPNYPGGIKMPHLEVNLDTDFADGMMPNSDSFMKRLLEKARSAMGGGGTHGHPGDDGVPGLEAALSGVLQGAAAAGGQVSVVQEVRGDSEDWDDEDDECDSQIELVRNLPGSRDGGPPLSELDMMSALMAGGARGRSGRSTGGRGRAPPPELKRLADYFSASQGGASVSTVELPVPDEVANLLMKRLPPHIAAAAVAGNAPIPTNGKTASSGKTKKRQR